MMKDESSMEPEHGFSWAVFVGLALLALPSGIFGALDAWDRGTWEVVKNACVWSIVGGLFGAMGGAVAGAIIFARRW
jgi:hypothetical protein